MMKSYVPTAASGVLAEQIPNPHDRDAFGAFVGRLIAQGHIRTIQPIDARPATEKSPEVKGGLYFRVPGAKGFTAQPGDWLVLTAEGNLKALTPEKWDKLGLVLDGPPTESRTEPADDQTPLATADRVLEDADEAVNGGWADSDDPTKRPKGRPRTVEPKAD